MVLNNKHIRQYLETAIDAARAAGRYALRNIRRRRRVVQIFAHDVKLELDGECQAVAARIIRRRYPRHAFLGEEKPGRKMRHKMPVWVVDPIDGTVNFFHGLPWWCCSVAVMEEGQTVAAAVYAPELDELYAAGQDGAACCNDIPLQVASTARLRDVVIATGLDKRPRRMASGLTFMSRLAARTHKMRIMGAAALDICNVAAGRTDAFFESGIYIWDVAAADLIVRRAGGKTCLRRQPGHRVDFLAAAGGVYPVLRRLTGQVCRWPD